MRRRILLLLLVLFGPILILNAFLIVPEAREVARTGMCPGAPPDISPSPCTIDEYLNRLVFSPFAQAGQLFLCLVWFGIVGLGVMGWWLLQKQLQRLKQ